jgi:hypothetical protein
MRRRNIEDRFREKVLEVEGGCHEWQSTLHRDGYGKFWFDGRQVQAHRSAWRIFRGEVPDGLHVLHHCDNRKCVNLEHLYLGTPADNVRDKIERCAWWGRMKYSFEQVEEARALYSIGMSQQKIADRLGMHQTQVSKYVRGTQRQAK